MLDSFTMVSSVLLGDRRVALTADSLVLEIWIASTKWNPLSYKLFEYFNGYMTLFYIKEIFKY